MKRQYNYVSQPVMATLLGVVLAVYAGWIWLMPPVAAGQADSASPPSTETTTTDTTMPDINTAADEPALNELTPEQYNVCFLKGTEPPGSGEYNHLFDAGTYHCAACSAALFSSETKYDSGSGWPAFYDAIGSDAVTSTVDNTLGMRRIEVTCANCGAHLGHVFDDGPPPTGQRYCINSLAMEFVPEAE